jgi:hypothetical protein
VVLLMALLGQTAEQTAAARLIGTGIGAALGLIGYLAWPSWEGESTQQKLARLFETQAHFAAIALRAYVGPGAMDAHAQRLSAGSAGRTVRQARSDAEASADRLADEPSRPPMTARLAYGLTGIGRRIAHASLTLQAAVEAAHAGQKAPGGKTGDGAEKAGSRETPAGDAKADGERIEGLAGAVDQFADGVETAGQVIAGSLRSLRPPGDMPPLRELQTAIYDQLSQPRTTAGPASRNGDGRDLADRNEPANRLTPSGSQDPAYGQVTTNGQDRSAAGQARVVSRARTAGRTQGAEPGTGRTSGPDAGHGTRAGTGHGTAAGTGHGTADAVHGTAADAGHGTRAGTGHGTAADAGHGTRAGMGHTTGPGLAPDDTDAVLLGATDEFTDALDTAADLLRRRLNGS